MLDSASKDTWKRRATFLRFSRGATHSSPLQSSARVRPLDKHPRGRVESSPMISSLQKSVEEFKAELEAHRDALRQELEETERLLEQIHQFSPSKAADRRALSTASPQGRENGEASTSSRKGTTKQTGLPKGVSRRQAVTRIISEFDKDTFEPKDVREKYIERYPQADAPHLTPSISSLLRQMSERGEIKRLGRRGDSPNDPYVYQKVESPEGRLGLES